MLPTPSTVLLTRRGGSGLEHVPEAGAVLAADQLAPTEPVVLTDLPPHAHAQCPVPARTAVARPALLSGAGAERS